jgi:flagellar basal body-associated protein FliL
MRSLFGMVMVMIVVILVVAAAGLIWHLSKTAEFSRNDAPKAAEAR